MVWSIAIANILGSGLCYVFSSQFAKLASLRYSLILPVVLSLVYIGAFEGKRQWGDLYSLLFFGVFAWGMKHFKWPRPPLVLGFILGGVLERYMFISIQRYGITWMMRPLVVVMFSMSILSLLGPFIKDVRSHGGIKGMLSEFHAPKLRFEQIFPAFMLCLFAVMMIEAVQWNFYAKIIPMIVGFGAIIFCSLSLLNDLFKAETHKAKSIEAAARGEVAEKIHMDIGSNINDMPARDIILRGVIFFGWMVAFLCSMALIGLIPTVPIFIVSFMRIEGKEPWKITMPMAIIMCVFIWFVFDFLLSLPWPGSYLGDYWQWWKDHVPSA
jgi:hypothetical protein